MKKNRFFLVVMVALSCLMMQSCWVTKTPVNDYYLQDGISKRYSKTKQFWFLEGFIPIGRSHVNLPPEGVPFMIEEKFTFGDVLLSGLTGGIITMRTIKCYVKSSNMEDIRNAKMYGTSINGTSKRGDNVTINYNSYANQASETSEVEEVVKETPKPKAKSTTTKVVNTSGQAVSGEVGEHVQWTDSRGTLHTGVITKTKDSATCVVKDDKNGAEYIKKYSKLSKIFVDDDDDEAEF